MEARYQLVPTETTAFGLRGGKFVNELVGARFGFAWTPRGAFELGVSYANLRGKEGRAHNVLPEVSFFYRLPLPGPALGVPLRFGAGFLPRNGPTLRLSAGIDCVISDSAVLELMLLEPMVWVTHDRPEPSLDVGVAVRIGL